MYLTLMRFKVQIHRSQTCPDTKDELYLVNPDGNLRKWHATKFVNVRHA